MQQLITRQSSTLILVTHSKDGSCGLSQPFGSWKTVNFTPERALPSPVNPWFKHLRLIAWQVHFRHACRHPIVSSLFCLIIAIGVASFYSIRLANRAAITGFGLFDRSIGIQADLILTSPSGRMRPDQLQLAQDLVRDLPVVFCAGSRNNGQ